MRRAIWPVVAILLAAASFGIGRLGGGVHVPPAMVAALPGDEAGFSQEFDDRVRARFPLGSNEDALIDYLVSEKFTPELRRRDAPI